MANLFHTIRDLFRPRPDKRPQEGAPDPQELFRQRLYEVCEVPELYCREDLRRIDLARQMGMGHSSFSVKIKQATGMNYNEYINQLRIRKATELLSNQTMDMGSIGQSVGYRYRSTFYRAFAAVHHCTPIEYQSRHLPSTSN